MSNPRTARIERRTSRRKRAPLLRMSGWCRLLLAIIVVVCASLAQLSWPSAVQHPRAATAVVSSSNVSTRTVGLDAFSDPVHAILARATQTTATPSKPAPAAPIQLSAKAAYAVDLTNGVELYSVNADVPLPPASTTKIVTAIVVVQHTTLDASVTIQADDTVDPTIYSHMGLEVGDIVTIRDLLAGMLLNSGGDAALALARTVGAALPGTADEVPRQRFVDEMNREASMLGMKHSHFVNPDGRDTDGHVSSARDLALAAQRLFEFPVLETLVGETAENVAVQGPNARTIGLVNTNELLGAPGVHGVKTGTTDAAGECLVIATWENGARVITVLLGSGDRYGDEQTLLSYLGQQFRWERLGRDGSLPQLNEELAQKGYSLGIVKSVVLTAQQAADLKYELNLQPAPGGGPFNAEGDVVFLIGAQPILRLSVYAGDPFNHGG